MRLFLAIQLSPAVREALLTAQDALRRQGRGSFPPPENLHLTLAFLGEAEDPARARVLCLPQAGQGPGRPVGGILPTFLLGGGRPAGAFRRPVVGRCSSRSGPGGAGRVPAGGPSLPGLLPGGPPLAAPHHPGPPLAGRGPAGDRPPRQHGGPADLPPAVRPD